MSFRERNKSLLDTGTTTILASLALLVSLNIFPFAIFLFPIPFIVLGVNYRIRNSLAAIVIGALIIGLVLDPASGLMIALMFIPLTVAMIKMIEKDFKPGKTILITSMILVVILMLMVFSISSILEVNFVDETARVFRESFDRELEGLKETGLNKEELLKIEDFFDRLLDNVLVNMPSVYIIIASIVAYLNYFLATKILKKDGYNLKYQPVFADFRLPKSIFSGLIMMFILSYIFSKLNILNGQGIMSNLIVLGSFVFSLQGIAVLAYALKKRGMKAVGRFFLILLVLVVLRINSIFVFLGMFDVFFDFRKLEKRI